MAQAAWRLLERRDVWLLAAGAGALLAASLLELLVPPLAASALFRIVEQRPWADVLECIGLLTAVTAGYSLMNGSYSLMFHSVRNAFVRRLREEAFRTLLFEGMAFHDQTDPGELTTRVSADSQAVFNALNEVLNFLLRSAVLTVCGIVALLRISVHVTVGVSAVLMALAVCTGWYAGVSQRAARSTQDAMAGLNRIAIESLSMLRTVRALDAESVHSRLYSDMSREAFEIQRRRGLASGIFSAATTSLTTLARAVALLTGGLLLLRPGSIITGEVLTTYLFYLDAVTESALSLGVEWSCAMEAFGAGERVLSLAATPRSEPGRARRSDAMQGDIAFEAVSFAYPSRPSEMALDRVSFQCPAGCWTAVVGHTGSGKSSIIALVQRLYDPTDGRVLLDGADVQGLDVQELRSQLGVVTQQPNLFRGSVAENIGWGLADPSLEDVQEVARTVGIDDLIRGLPEGYDTIIGDTMLSAAQRQQIAIARALMRDPAVLLLDEPTAALDPGTCQLVMDAICRSRWSPRRGRNRSIIMVAHRLETVQGADQILVMQAGRVVESGTASELMARGGGFARLVEDQRLPTEHTPRI